MGFLPQSKVRSDKSECKRILFINPAKEDSFPIGNIHQGFSLLAEILVTHGHTVKVLDYAFLKSVKHSLCIPRIEDVIQEYQPHAIGISVFTYLYHECQHVIAQIAQCSQVPIILGGPHFSVFPEDFNNDPRISYIVRGEAERIILDLVETITSQPHLIVIDAPLPSSEEIPPANIEVAYGHQHLFEYRIQLSRGCPYNCSFCTVRFITGKRIRARNIEQCVQEIVTAKKHYPHLTGIRISDDCPTFDMSRFKQFLRLLKDAQTGCSLAIDNIRANLLDEELLQLYKEAGGTNICLGVESADPDVFASIHKGESFGEIIQAAKLVRQYGLTLGFCFVIGLPYDTLKRHQTSIHFATAFQPDYCFWNMCIPWPGTEISQWYQEHGEITDIRDFSTLIAPDGNFRPPVAFSCYFSRRDLIKAWLMANMETHDYFSPRRIFRLIGLTVQYSTYRSFVIYLFRFFFPKVMASQKRRLLHIIGSCVRRGKCILKTNSL